MSNLQVPLGLPARMVGLNDEQVVKLAERIVRWMLEDNALLWKIALGQARAWTLDEYRELLKEEGHGEQV